jgi:hypothetical protein
MFDRIRNALTRTASSPAARAAQARASAAADAPVSEWASTHGLSFAADGAGGARLEGQVRGRPWRLERGKPTRDYVVGQELRARAELAFTLLLRGRAYLRMEYRPANPPTLQHAALVFTSACEAALRAPLDGALD